jgi:hypothetical protein
MSDKVTGTMFMDAVRRQWSFTPREAARMREQILRQDASQQARGTP